MTLTENEGIDVLGNIIESTILSPNRDFYGDLHNMGHVLFAYLHDPDHRHLVIIFNFILSNNNDFFSNSKQESFGVMGDAAVDMRDPVFYRWHAYIDDMFQEYKATLPRYTVAQVTIYTHCIILIILLK